MITMSNQISGKRFIGLGALSMFLAVGAGAFGAHGLKHLLSVELLAVYHTAVEYQIYHSLGLIFIGQLVTQRTNAAIRFSAWLMLTGMVIFSGSLYLLSITGIRWLGAITPVGGVFFLLAWLLLAWHTLKSTD